MAYAQQGTGGYLFRKSRLQAYLRSFAVWHRRESLTSSSLMKPITRFYGALGARSYLTFQGRAYWAPRQRRYVCPGKGLETSSIDSLWVQVLNGSYSTFVYLLYESMLRQRSTPLGLARAWGISRRTNYSRPATVLKSSATRSTTTTRSRLDSAPPCSASRLSTRATCRRPRWTLASLPR